MEVALKMRPDLPFATRGTSRRLDNGIDSWARRVIQCPLHAFPKIAVARMPLAGSQGATLPRSRELCRERFAFIGVATAVCGVSTSKWETVENIMSINYPRLPCVVFATAPRKQVNVITWCYIIFRRRHRRSGELKRSSFKSRPDEVQRDHVHDIFPEQCFSSPVWRI